MIKISDPEATLAGRRPELEITCVNVETSKETSGQHPRRWGRGCGGGGRCCNSSQNGEDGFSATPVPIVICDASTSVSDHPGPPAVPGSVSSPSAQRPLGLFPRPEHSKLSWTAHRAHLCLDPFPRGFACWKWDSQQTRQLAPQPPSGGP